jgi:hypothetical protein
VGRGVAGQAKLAYSTDRRCDVERQQIRLGRPQRSWALG